MHRLIILLSAFIPAFVMAQEKENEPFAPKVRGAIMMANAHVPNAFQGEKKIAIIPAWGFDVDYFFSLPLVSCSAR